jgi:hypothetical protein
VIGPYDPADIETPEPPAEPVRPFDNPADAMAAAVADRDAGLYAPQQTAETDGWVNLGPAPSAEQAQGNLDTPPPNAPCRHPEDARRRRSNEERLGRAVVEVRRTIWCGDCGAILYDHFRCQIDGAEVTWAS